MGKFDCHDGRVSDRLPHLSKRTQAIYVAIAIGRTIFSAVVILMLYEWIPIRATASGLALAGLMTVALVIWLVVVIRQMAKIRRAVHPVLRIGEALVSTIIVIVVVFAIVYLALDGGNTESFSQPLDKTAALYFSMTVTATVGFGDITAITPLARNIVTFQMFVNLVFLGVALRSVTMTAQSARDRQLEAANERLQSMQSAEVADSKAPNPHDSGPEAPEA